MMSYCGKFTLTLAHGQYIGTETSPCTADEIIMFVLNPSETHKTVNVILSSAELRTVADLIDLVREATPLDKPERREFHEHLCCIHDKKTSHAIGFIEFRALPDEKGVSLKVTDAESTADEETCTVTMTNDEAGRVADSFHKIASARQLELGRS